jgi:hypothetical protein
MMLAAVLALTLSDINWLAGDWELTTGNRCVEEHWTTASANLVVGMSRTVDAGRTVSFEFVRIEARTDGVYYVAQPGGKPPVDFKLTDADGPALTFVNPGHADHLQRIIYRPNGADGLFARVEGENGGRAFSEDYAYRRAPGNAADRCRGTK